MAEKKKPNSYLNPRSVNKSEVRGEDVVNKGVKIDELSQATVKIVSDVAAFSNPYSGLVNDFGESKTKALATNFVIDQAELAGRDVKLTAGPREEIVIPVLEDRPVEQPEVVEVEKAPEAKTPVEQPKLADISPIEIAAQAPKISDMELLNNMSALPEIPQSTTSAKSVNVEVPKGVELEPVAKPEQDDSIEQLNQIQAAEAAKEAEKEKRHKEQLQTNSSDLEALLAELENEGDGGFSVSG